MDDAGVDVHVLSLTTPGTQNLEPDQAVALQKESNDLLAETVRAHPDRLQGLATLATPAPAQAARELERAVTTLGLDGAMLFGRTRDLNLEHPSFWPIFEAAADLNAPLYLHPQSPPPAVRTAYYDGFGAEVDAAFATHGVGWHYETGVQILRLILAGVFDRFPELQMTTGHWGELILFFLDRIDQLAEAAKPAAAPVGLRAHQPVRHAQRHPQPAIPAVGQGSHRDRPHPVRRRLPVRAAAISKRESIPGTGGPDRSRARPGRLRQLGAAPHTDPPGGTARPGTLTPRTAKWSPAM